MRTLKIAWDKAYAGMDSITIHPLLFRTKYQRRKPVKGLGNKRKWSFIYVYFKIDIKSFHIDPTLIPGNETKWSDFLAKTRTSITSKEGGGQEELVCCFLIRSHFPRAVNYETTISNTPSSLFFVLFSALIKESKLQITSEITIKYPFTGFCFRNQSTVLSSCTAFSQAFAVNWFPWQIPSDPKRMTEAKYWGLGTRQTSTNVRWSSLKISS